MQRLNSYNYNSKDTSSISIVKKKKRIDFKCSSFAKNSQNVFCYGILIYSIQCISNYECITLQSTIFLSLANKRLYYLQFTDFVCQNLCWLLRNAKPLSEFENELPEVQSDTLSTVRRLRSYVWHVIKMFLFMELVPYSRSYTLDAQVNIVLKNNWLPCL